MSDRITRRTALRAGAAALAGGLAGCLSADGTGESGETADTSDRTPTETPSPTATETPTPTETGTYADVPDGPEPYPDRPTDADRESAVTFAREFEYARVYNGLHESNVEDLHAESHAVHDVAAHGGHYVLATGSGYANYEDNLHADWGQAPAFYFVSPDLVVRAEDLDSRYFDCHEVFAAEDSSENFAQICEGGDASYRAYNLHPEPRTVSVTVEYLDDGDVVSVLEREYDLASGTGVIQESVTYRRGTYRVTASLADGPSTTAEWVLEREPTYEDPPLTVVVTPVDDVRIRRVPFPSL